MQRLRDTGFRLTSRLSTLGKDKTRDNIYWKGEKTEKIERFQAIIRACSNRFSHTIILVQKWHFLQLTSNFYQYTDNLYKLTVVQFSFEMGKTIVNCGAQPLKWPSLTPTFWYSWFYAFLSPEYRLKLHTHFCK